MASDPVLFLARLHMAWLFFVSGRQKLLDWDATLYLFQYEYKLPFLPPDVAAYSGTFFELVMPVLLAFGFLTRLAALPLIVMSATIQFVLGATNPDYNNPQHILWILVLALIATQGAGRWSVDHFLRKRLMNQ